jgi:hypothetical protein
MTDLRTSRIQPLAPAAAPGRVRRIRADDPRGQSRHHPSNHQPTDEPSAETGGGLSPSYAEVLVDPNTGAVVIRVRASASHTLLQELDAPELERVSRQLRSYSVMLARWSLTRARKPA